MYVVDHAMVQYIRVHAVVVYLDLVLRRLHMQVEVWSSS